MTLPNTNLTREQAQWLANDYPNYIGRRIDRGTIQQHLRAFNLIRGTNETIPSCSCQWTSAAKISESLYSQYKNEIETLAK